MNTTKRLSFSSDSRNRLAIIAAAMSVIPFAAADITAPYTSDANTPYLFHFEEASGGSTALNSGTIGGNGLTYNQNVYPGGGAGATPGVATLSTTMLGASSFTGFGTAVNTNPNNVTSNATAVGANGAGIGIDFNNSGTFNISRNATASADYVGLTTLANPTTKAFTLEAIIKTSSASQTQEIISTDSSSTPRGFLFRLTTAGFIEFNDVGGTTPSSIVSTVAVSDPALGANTWTASDFFHIALSYDGTNATFYWTKVDPVNTLANQLGTPLALTAANINLTASGPLVLGNEGRFSSTGAVFSNEGLLGTIDEVRISTVGRTADQFIFAAAPEPGAASLVGIGLLALVVFRRRGTRPV